MPYLGPEMHQRIRKLLHLVRDAWLMVGLALALLLLLEGGYRLQAAMRQQIGLRLIQQPGPPVPDETSRYPYADSAWFQGWPARRDSALRIGWRHHPYRGWTVGPLVTDGITIDTEGLRLVPGGRIGSGRDTVFLLGGSTAWGYTARDSFTIAAHIAGGLRRRGVDDVEVVSLAQAGYNFLQGIATLQEQLRFGSRPAAVVFFDGVNEIGPLLEGEPLWGAYGQQLVAERIALGKRTPVQEIVGLGRHLAIVDRLRLVFSPPIDGHPDIPDEICDVVAPWYLAGARVVGSMAVEFGFADVLVWQPSLGATGKRLSDYEAYRSAWDEDVGLEVARLMRRCVAAVDSTMALHPAVPYVSFNALFDDDTTSVFLDGFGHVTELANGVIGDSIAGLVAARLSRRGD